MVMPAAPENLARVSTVTHYHAGSEAWISEADCAFDGGRGWVAAFCFVQCSNGTKIMQQLFIMGSASGHFTSFEQKSFETRGPYFNG